MSYRHNFLVLLPKSHAYMNVLAAKESQSPGHKSSECFQIIQNSSILHCQQLSFYFVSLS